MFLSLDLPVPQRYVGFQDDVLVIVAGCNLDVERFHTVVGKLASDDNLRAVEVVGEQMLSDVLDRVLGVVDPDVGQ